MFINNYALSIDECSLARCAEAGNGRMSRAVRVDLLDQSGRVGLAVRRIPSLPDLQWGLEVLPSLVVHRVPVDRVDPAALEDLADRAVLVELR